MLLFLHQGNGEHASSPLELLPQRCKKVYTGKRGGQQSSAKQPDIDELLVSACREVGCGRLGV